MFFVVDIDRDSTIVHCLALVKCFILISCMLNLEKIKAQLTSQNLAQVLDAAVELVGDIFYGL